MELEGSFELNEKISLHKKDYHCIEDPTYSYKTCILNFIANSSGCHFDWFNGKLDDKNDNRHPPCSTREQILEYNKHLNDARMSSWVKLSKESGCHAKCKIRKYSFSQHSKEKVIKKQDWSSAFYLQAKETLVRMESENWLFDNSDLVNGIGGAMGLFLGWSVLYLVSEGGNLVKRAWEMYNKY